MNGKWPVLALVLSGLGAGVGVWYAQEYAYYTETTDPTGASHAQPALRGDGRMTTLAVRDYREIDATSSPTRWRACFTLADPGAAEGLQPYTDATPLNGPRWFDCYDSGKITADLASGVARAVLGQAEVRPDVDCVLAIYPDGRVFGWHQYNDKTPPRGVMD